MGGPAEGTKKERKQKERQNPEAIKECRSAGSVAHADLLHSTSLVTPHRVCVDRLRPWSTRTEVNSLRKREKRKREKTVRERDEWRWERECRQRRGMRADEPCSQSARKLRSPCARCPLLAHPHRCCRCLCFRRPPLHCSLHPHRPLFDLHPPFERLFAFA